jgi:uracil-DNA glycosylase
VTSEAFVREVAAARIGATWNFYREGAGASVRRARLRAYLERRWAASLLLVGEAPGYRGARVSGIPFTSERQLSGNPPGESTATIVHRALDELGLADDVLLWNVVPTHPHLQGRPETNRPPTAAEIEAGLPFVRELARGRAVLAVGRVAHGALDAPYVRHPSHGGATAFTAALVDYASS